MRRVPSDRNEVPAAVEGTSVSRRGRVVIAPDTFKGSLPADRVTHHLAVGWRRACPDADVVQVPMADGGEGTVAAAVCAGWRERSVTVRDPLGDEVPADYALSADGTAAVVELAQASGLSHSPADAPAARHATSYGTGELIAHALDAGARTILLGVGGSACTDGGAGMAQALGARLLSDSGAELPGGGAALAHLAAVDLGGMDPRLRETNVVLAADVDNPLLGPHGAVAVYAAQKGADAPARRDLEAGLERWVEALAAALPDASEIASAPGAGAAGGVGYAALALLGANRRPGIDVAIELTELEEKLEGACLVITGEGSLDGQSLHGKAPVGVARAAAVQGVRTVAACGRSELTAAELRCGGLSASYALSDLQPDESVSIRDAGKLLEQLGAVIALEYG